MQKKMHKSIGNCNKLLKQNFKTTPNTLEKESVNVVHIVKLVYIVFSHYI